MERRHSDTYLELCDFIKKEPMTYNTVIYNVCLHLARDEAILFSVFLCLACVIAAIVCIFTPFKHGIWIFFLLAVCFFASGKLIVEMEYVVNNRDDKLSRMEIADTVFLEDKNPYDIAVAGYHYYVLYKNYRVKSASKRLQKLLDTPEFFAYFNENELSYDSKKEFMEWFSRYGVGAYKKFVSDYYGDKLKKTETYALFYKSNAMMFYNQLINGDEIKIKEVAEDADLYSRVKQYYNNWCNGDAKSYELFKKYYMNEAILRGHEEERKKQAEFLAQNSSLSVVFSDGNFEFSKIMEYVAEQLAKKPNEKPTEQPQISSKTDALFYLLMELPPDFEKIEAECKKQKFTAEEITEVACRFAERCEYEGEYTITDPTIALEKEKVHSLYLYKVCELLLKYGLDPNLVLGERLRETNILQELVWVDYPNVAAETMKLLLDNGADLNVPVDDETVFEYIDINIASDANDNQGNYYPEMYLAQFQMWILMIGYGATMENGKCPITILHDYPIENFKDFKNFTYKIEKLEKGWIMHIFDTRTNIEVAQL